MVKLHAQFNAGFRFLCFRSLWRFLLVVGILLSDVPEGFAACYWTKTQTVTGCALYDGDPPKYQQQWCRPLQCKEDTRFETEPNGECVAWGIRNKIPLKGVSLGKIANPCIKSPSPQAQPEGSTKIEAKKPAADRTTTQTIPRDVAVCVPQPESLRSMKWVIAQTINSIPVLASIFEKGDELGSLGKGQTKLVKKMKFRTGQESIETASYSHKMKRDGSRQKFERLENELRIYRLLDGVPGIARSFYQEIKTTKTGTTLDHHLELYPEGALSQFVEIKDQKEQTPESKETITPIDPARVPKLAKGICTTLQAMHDKGIYHRDLKPQNVFLSKGEARLADFDVSADAESILNDSFDLCDGTPIFQSQNYKKTCVELSGELEKAKADFKKTGKPTLPNAFKNLFEELDHWGIGQTVLNLLDGKLSPWQAGLVTQKDLEQQELDQYIDTVLKSSKLPAEQAQKLRRLLQCSMQANPQPGQSCFKEACDNL